MSSRLAFFGVGSGSPDEIARGKRRAGMYNNIFINNKCNYIYYLHHLCLQLWGCTDI